MRYSLKVRRKSHGKLLIRRHCKCVVEDEIAKEGYEK